ncbi:MAG TPA: hypothetical protein VF172_06200 [Nitrososphaera sp.]
MKRIPWNQGEKRSRPFCQATGCFELADSYIVLKETEEPDYYHEVSRESNYEQVEKSFGGDDETEFDGFKMIVYFCRRHDGEFKYLIRGSELRIAKRRNLHALEIRQGR